MIVTERTRERAQQARFEKDCQWQAPKTYSYERAGRLWNPKRERLQLLGGGPCGSFAARGGAPNDVWQPTDVAGFVLDLDPRFGVTIDNSLGSPHVSQITNHAPSASDAFANSTTSLQPAFESGGWGGPLGRPSILFNGTSHYLVCTTSLVTTLAGGTDTPFSILWVGQQLTTTGTQNHLGFFRTTSTSPIWDLFTSAGTYSSFRRDNAATSVSVTGGTPDTSKHVFESVYSGTSLLFRIDSVAQINNVSQDVGAITFDAMCLGSTYSNASPNNWANLRLARTLGFTGALNSTDASYVRAGLTTSYF